MSLVLVPGKTTLRRARIVQQELLPTLPRRGAHNRAVMQIRGSIVTRNFCSHGSRGNHRQGAPQTCDPCVVDDPEGKKGDQPHIRENSVPCVPPSVLVQPSYQCGHSVDRYAYERLQHLALYLPSQSSCGQAVALSVTAMFAVTSQPSPRTAFLNLLQVRPKRWVQTGTKEVTEGCRLQ